MNNAEIVVQNKKTGSITLLLLLGLLFLRFPLLISLAYIKNPALEQLGVTIFQDGTYLLTAIFILLKRDSLIDYHIDFKALLIFIIAPAAKPLAALLLIPLTDMRKIPIGNLVSYPWVEIAISICLLIALIIYRPKLCKRGWKNTLIWILIAVAAGLLGGAFSGTMLSFQDQRGLNTAGLPILIISFFTQLANAAVIEEPLFRGFLWGFLKNIHWKEHWIWLFQAGLFILGHIYYAGTYNYSFFIVVPFGALLLGLVAWRSRSIGSTMIVHGLFNSLSDMVAHMTWR